MFDDRQQIAVGDLLFSACERQHRVDFESFPLNAVIQMFQFEIEQSKSISDQVDVTDELRHRQIVDEQRYVAHELAKSIGGAHLLQEHVAVGEFEKYDHTD